MRCRHAQRRLCQRWFNSPVLLARQHRFERHQRRVQPIGFGQRLVPSLPEHRRQRRGVVAGDALFDERHQIADLARLAQVAGQAVQPIANALLLRGDRGQALALGGLLLLLDFAPQIRLPRKSPFILILGMRAQALLGSFEHAPCHRIELALQRQLGLVTPLKNTVLGLRALERKLHRPARRPLARLPKPKAHVHVAHLDRSHEAMGRCHPPGSTRPFRPPIPCTPSG